MAVAALQRIIDVITWIDCNGINETVTIPVREDRTVDYVKAWIMDNRGVDLAYQAISYWCNHAGDWVDAPWHMQMIGMEYNGVVNLWVQDSQMAIDERAPISDTDSESDGDHESDEPINEESDSDSVWNVGDYDSDSDIDAGRPGDE